MVKTVRASFSNTLLHVMSTICAVSANIIPIALCSRKLSKKNIDGLLVYQSPSLARVCDLAELGV
jgi:hypothetical protein